MPQQPITVCEVFNVWGIDLMGPFPHGALRFFSTKEHLHIYILSQTV